MTDVPVERYPTEADALEEPPSAEIVHWFDDPFWRVRFVPTAAAFTAGAVAGALATLLAVRLLDD